LSYFSFFFFSSRRRHTRFSRDWSSDVCSSDLRQDLPDELAQELGLARDAIVILGDVTLGLLPRQLERDREPRERRAQLVRDVARSEERRVGKECGEQRATDQ